MSKNKELRKVAFTVYLGDYNEFYWIGVRNNIRQKISELFSAKFEKLYGGHYFATTYGRYPNISLIAKYKYNRGEIIEYAGEEMLGKTRIDTNKWYGSGLKVVSKQIFSSSLGNINLRSKQMVQISKERILELQRIFEKEYKKKISFAEATEAANNLVGFFDLLLEIDTRDKNKLKKSNNQGN